MWIELVTVKTCENSRVLLWVISNRSGKWEKMLVYNNLIDRKETTQGHRKGKMLQ